MNSDRKGGTQFYVAPDAGPGGDGSLQHPWDLATALAQPKAVGPGDTIWLRGGSYRGCFVSTLVGSESAPIIVRQYAGERAVIDGDGCSTGQTDAERSGKSRKALTVKGAFVWFWGFELMNSNPVRETASAGSNPDGIKRGDGVTVYGAGTKLINLVIHDAGDGVGFWRQAVDAEVYGCVIYNNGWVGPDRGHGHGLYIQNEAGTKRVSEVVSFNNFATGMKAYGKRGAIVGIHFEGVVSFNNGSPADQQRRVENLFVGPDGPVPADRIDVVDNFLYQPPGIIGTNLHIGYDTKNNQRILVSGNYIAGGDQPLIIDDWKAGKISGNTVYAQDTGARGRRSKLVNLMLAEGSRPASFEWENNTYFSEAGEDSKEFPFSLSGEGFSFDAWRQASGFDRNSRYHLGRPTGLNVFVRPNQYEAGRANVIIYNWERKASVEVDLSNVLQRGAKYEIRNVQDYLGTPVLSGTYDGRPVTIPMANLKVAGPIGYNRTPQTVGPDFGVFVVLTTNAGLPVERQAPTGKKQ